MIRRIVDLGFGVAILDSDDMKVPLLTIMIPDTDEEEAKSIYILGLDGLRALQDLLREGLDEYEAEPEVITNPLDKGNETA